MHVSHKQVQRYGEYTNLVESCHTIVSQEVVVGRSI